MNDTETKPQNIPSMKPRFFTGLFAAMLLTIPAFGTESDSAGTLDQFQKTFSVSSGGKLAVDVNVGSIEVATTSRDEVRVEVYRKAVVRDRSGKRDVAKERDLLDQNEVSLGQEGQTVTVRGRKREGEKFSHRGSVSLQVRFVVTVPEKFNADLKTSGGGITVVDLAGDLKARTSGGGLKFANIQGPIDGHTSGGGIKLTKCDGTVDVETSGGGIEMSGGSGNASIKTSGGSIQIGSHGGDVVAHTSGGGIIIVAVEGKLDASTSGGSVTATLPGQLPADWRLETSGGGITVRVPEDATLDLDASTSGGGVRTDLPVTTDGEQKRGRLKGKINGGGKSLVLRTSAGSIHVKKL